MMKVTTFVKPDLTRLSGVNQEQVIKKFLPFELIPAGWRCQNRSLIENIKSLYGDSNKRIQMYGSPESLEKSLMIFMSFPGNQQVFQLKDYDFYKTFLPVYQSLGGNNYIYRKDVYDVLLEYIPTIHTIPSIETLAQNLMSFYLRTLKNRVPTSHEMVGVYEEFKQELVEKRIHLEVMMRSGEWEKHGANFSLDQENSVQLLDTIAKLFDEKIGTKIGRKMREKITMVTKDAPVHENVSEYMKMLIWFDLTTESFEDFISKNKSMMFSRSETVDSIPTSRIPVRLFESSQEKVVMSHELLHAIKLEKLDVSRFEKRILAMPSLSVISFREVFEMIPSDIFKMLEFVRVPLRHVSKELTIIPTIDGSHCLSAYQYVVMIFCDVIIVKKLFQGMKSDQWSSIMTEFYDMLIDTLSDGSFFISYKIYEQAKFFLGTWFHRNFPSPNKKEISYVNKNGFTCKDLRNQLERLDLSEVFPGITNFASKMPPNRTTNGCSYEATRQMLQRIQDIQFSYVFNCLPKKLVKIFHKRKWCVKLLPNRCPLCIEKQSAELSVKTKEDSKVPAESKEVQKKENIPEIIVSSSDASCSDSESSSTEKSDESEPENLPSSATAETVVVGKQVAIQNSKMTKKNKNDKSAEKPEVKESQACPKCIRASEYTVKTNEQLRLSKIEVKHLKKELSEVQLALEKKEERIRILEEKLLVKETQINMKTSEVVSLNTEKQQMEQKNKKNEKLVATYQEEILKKDMTIKYWKNQNYEKDKLIKELKSEEPKSIPSISTEENVTVDSLLSTLLETKIILSKEDPIKKSNEICDALVSKTNSKITQQFVKYETRVFQLQVSSYIQTVENNIKLIRGNQAIKSDQIPEIPDFPEFSGEFKNFHKFILKKEAPLLCRQLLNLTDEIADMECVICINEMESHEDTTKCGHCKRRYHNHCIKIWLKKKSICPTCKHRMVDDQEFPAL